MTCKIVNKCLVKMSKLRVQAKRRVVAKLYGGYGEQSWSGMRAGHQDKMFQGGNATMDREFPRLDHLIRASIVREK